MQRQADAFTSAADTIGSGRRIRSEPLLMADTTRVWPARTVLRQYILLSHAMGRALSNGHIVDRVRLEQSIAALLGVGLCSPFHAKTLKMVTQVASFGSSPLDFLNLLRRHVLPLQAGRWVLVVVDDLSLLPFDDLPDAARAVVLLCANGIQVLVKHPDGTLIPLKQGAHKLSTVKRELYILWCLQAGQTVPQAAQILERA